MRQYSIGDLMFYPVGTNPYHRDTANPYRIGEQRKQALAAFQATGQLPEGFALWSDREKHNVTNPALVSW